METSTHSFSKHTILFYIDILLMVLWGIALFLFPLVVSSSLTNAFLLTKEFFLLFASLVMLLLWGVKTLVAGKIVFRRTPLDIPLTLFTIILLVSALLAVNRFDALFAFASFLPLALMYFLILQIARKEHIVQIFFLCLSLSACVLSLLTISSFFKIYLLPFSYAHTQSFTLIGSYLEQALFFSFILPVAGYFAYPLTQNKINKKSIGFSLIFFLVAMGFVVTVVYLLTSQKPLILPFETGFQIAFAAISQDAGRIFQGFFFGSGFGNFLTDFSRFKLATFNLNQSLWYVVFNQSSSFALELLTTTGLLGFLSFLFVVIKICKSPKFLKNPFALSLVLLIVAAFVLPLGYLNFMMLFLMLAFFAGIEALKERKDYFDIELQSFAFRKTHTGQTEEQKHPTTLSTFIVVAVFIVILAFVGFLGFFGYTFILSDMTFEKSLVAASQNKGLETYQDQVKAISEFPYRDFYYRSFSQTNLALANSLVVTQPQGQKMNDKDQKTLFALIQQSINAGRAATTYAPLTVANWQNLGSIYRALIGFGDKADQFALQTMQQGVALDSTNPQEYIALGGLYYQLGQYDNAINDFRIAASLKADYANAYYNLGHALEQKQDLSGALTQYRNVQSLVAGNPDNLKKIDAEIAALEKKISENQQNSGENTTTNQTPTPAPEKAKNTTTASQEPLGVSNPSAVLPTQKPPVKIPAPSVVTQTPSPTAKP